MAAAAEEVKNDGMRLVESKKKQKKKQAPEWVDLRWNTLDRVIESK